MADLFQFLPLTSETISAIRARIDAGANVGLSPLDPGYLDTMEGGFFWDLTQAIAQEIERLWDFAATEVPASQFLLYAWGDYLDEHGAALAVTRKDATSATGEVTFTGDGATSAFITVGTQVATPTTEADEEERTYETTESGTVPITITSVSATPSASGGTLASNTYYYAVTAVNADGETATSPVQSAVVTGPNGSVVLDWADIPGATSYKVYRSTTAGSGNQNFLSQPVVSNYTDTGSATTSATAPLISTATLTLNVEAVEVGTAGNTPSHSVTLLMTPVSGVASVTNHLPIAGGTDVEQDEDFRDRLLLEFTAQGAGTQADYQRWALAYEGVGRVTVQPLWAGNGTVRVMVMDTENQPVSQATMDGLQNELDPFNGQTQVNNGPGYTLPVGTITVDSTTGFRDSGRIRMTSSAGMQTVTYTGRTGTTFTGCTGGTGTVPDNTRVVQSGEGRGLAPIGAEVYVGTPSIFAVNVVAAITFLPGYSLDGLDGSIALRDELEEQLQTYINALDVGEDVILNHVEARFFRVRGVYDVSGTTLNGSAANLAVGVDQIAELNTVALT